MDKQEYTHYEEVVAHFFKDEGIGNLSYDTEEYGDGTEDDNVCIEPHFSWSPCDCCRRPLGGDRYVCSGFNNETKEIQDGYRICVDCYYYAEYGRLDDLTMEEVEKDD